MNLSATKRIYDVRIHMSHWQVSRALDALFIYSYFDLICIYLPAPRVGECRLLIVAGYLETRLKKKVYYNVPAPVK